MTRSKFPSRFLKTSSFVAKGCLLRVAVQASPLIAVVMVYL
jgi:hypothetical protein